MMRTLFRVRATCEQSAKVFSLEETKFLKRKTTLPNKTISYCFMRGKCLTRTGQDNLSLAIFVCLSTLLTEFESLSQYILTGHIISTHRMIILQSQGLKIF
jgi:hypothetical protein